MPPSDPATRTLVARVAGILASEAAPTSGALTESALERVLERALITRSELQTALDYLGEAGLVRVSAFGTLQLTAPAAAGTAPSRGG